MAMDGLNADYAGAVICQRRREIDSKEELLI
jgi:hypothetical protein